MNEQFIIGFFSGLLFSLAVKGIMRLANDIKETSIIIKNKLKEPEKEAKK